MVIFFYTCCLITTCLLDVLQERGLRVVNKIKNQQRHYAVETTKDLRFIGETEETVSKTLGRILTMQFRSIPRILINDKFGVVILESIYISIYILIAITA